MNKAKALFIVEGEDREKTVVNSLMSCLSELSDLNIHIVSVSANIHMLYQKLKENDYFLNIVDVICGLETTTEEDRRILNEEGPFAYRYLVFDLDLQHYDLTKEDNIQRGLAEAEEMLLYFQNETDESSGKLYINYPMIESYRDCKSTFEEEYANKVIEIEKCIDYKKIVGERGNNRNISSYSHDDFTDLICMNLYKLHWITKGNWSKMEYQQYRDLIRTNLLFEKEKLSITHRGIVKVINSLLLFPVDYRGNTHGYFNNLRPR